MPFTSKRAKLDVGDEEVRMLEQLVQSRSESAGRVERAKILLRYYRGATVSSIAAELRANQVQPHKIRYYLERRDPEFDIKMKQVLHVYKQVELWHKTGAPSELVAVLSYDEKPGIQAIENTAPDLPPVPGLHPSIDRDHEYIRHGTLSLLAGIDLLSGEVLGLVRDRHRSAEFIEFLRMTAAHYPS